MTATIVRMLLHQPLLPMQLLAARGHPHIVSAHNVNEHPFKTRAEHDWAVHWPKGLVIVAVDDGKDPIPYAQQVLEAALGKQLVPETQIFTLPVGSWKPNWTVPAGETIQETLEELGVTPLRLAERTGLAITHVKLLLTGEAAIDADTAVRLEHALGITAEFWLRLDAPHQIDRARKNHYSTGCTCRSLKTTTETNAP